MRPALRRAIGGLMFGAVGLAAFVALAPEASSAPTCDTNWTSNSGGLWSDAAKWDNGVPLSGGSACIVRNGTFTVTVDTSATVGRIIVGDPVNTGTKTLAIGTVGTAVTLGLDGAGTSQLTPRGAITVVNGGLVVDGSQTFHMSGGTLTNTAGELVHVTGGDTWRMSGGTHTGDPIFTEHANLDFTGASGVAASFVDVGATFLGTNVPAGVTLTIESRASATQSDLYLTGNVTNNGAINLTTANGCGGMETNVYQSGGAWTLTNTGTITGVGGQGGFRDVEVAVNNTTGTIRAAADATMRFHRSGGMLLRNAGTLETVATGAMEVHGSGEVLRLAGGTLSNAGSFLAVSGTVLEVDAGTITGNRPILDNTTIDFVGAAAPTGHLELHHGGNYLRGDVPAGMALTLSSRACAWAANLYLLTDATNNGTINLTDADGCGQSNPGINEDGGAAQRLTNAGTLNLLPGQHGGQRDIAINFTNAASGVVNVTSAGARLYPSGGTSTVNNGTINISAEGVLEVPNQGGHTFHMASGSIANAGRFVVSNGTTTFKLTAGALTGAGAFDLEGAYLDLAGATAPTGVLHLRHSNDLVAGNVPAGIHLRLEAKGCSYDGNLRPYAGFTNFGTITVTDIEGCGGGTTSLSSMNDPATSYTVTNEGTMNFTKTQGGRRYLLMSVLNMPAGVINSSAEVYQYGGNIFLENRGTMNILEGGSWGLFDHAGTRQLRLPAGGVLNNAGVLEIRTVTALITGGTINTTGAGESSVGGGPVVDWDSGTFTGNPVMLFSTRLDTSGGTAQTGSVLMRHENTLTGPIPAGVTMTLSGQSCAWSSNVGLLADTVNNGTIIQTATPGCGGSGTGLFSEGDSSPTRTLTNNGTIRLLQGPQGGRRSLQVHLNNTASGVVEVASDDGYLYARNSVFTNNGTVTVDPGASLYNHNHVGTRTWNLNGGTITNNGSLGTDGATVTFAGGTIVGANPLQLHTSTLRLDSQNAAYFRLVAAGTLTKTGGGAVTTGASQRFDLLDACDAPDISVTGDLTNNGSFVTFGGSCGHNANLLMGPSNNRTFTNNGLFRVTDGVGGGGAYVNGAFDQGPTGRVEVLDPEMALFVEDPSPDFATSTLADGTWVLAGSVSVTGASAITTNAAVIDTIGGSFFNRDSSADVFDGVITANTGDLAVRGTMVLDAGAAGFTNNGRLRVFDTAKLLSATGPIALTATSTTDVEVTSPTATGVVEASGAGSITIDPAATLNLGRDPAYEPAIGANHDVFTAAAGITGTYTFPSKVHGWDLGVGAKALQLQYPTGPARLRLHTLQRTATIARATQNVGEQSGPAAFTVTLSITPEVAATVNASTFVPAGGDVDATPDADYTAITDQAVVFSAGDTVKTVNVTLNDDAIDEYAEDLGVAGVAVTSNVVIATASATRTIVDDDAAPVVSITLPSPLVEGPGIHQAVYDLALTGLSEKLVLVDYTTADGGAHAPRDFTAAGGRITVPKQGSGLLNVASIPAAISIGYTNHTRYSNVPATFTVALTAPDDTVTTHGTNGSIVSTIPNTTAAPNVLITGGRRVTEAATTVHFPVLLTAPADVPITVAYASAPGTATSGSDYTATSGTLSFAAGETTKSIGVPFLADAIHEADETFTLTLTSPSPAAVTILAGSDSSLGTIANDDAAPTLAVAGPSPVLESAGGQTYTVTKTGATELPATVGVGIVAGSASFPGDVSGAAQTLTFAPGDTTKTFTATITQDSIDEPNEAFSVRLSDPSGATVTTASKSVTISDDDTPPTLSVGDASTSESGGTVTVPVTLSAPSAQTATVTYATANGTAVAGTDYTAASGSVSFAPGQTVQLVTVGVLGNTIDQADRAFTVNLSTPANATIADGSGAVTVTDDDDAPALSITGPAATVEGDSGSTAATFTVTLGQASGKTVTVGVALTNGTTTGADVTGTPATLTFTPGQTTMTFNAGVLGDTADEDDETYTVTLASPTNATLTAGAATATGTITDDDGTPVVSVSSPATHTEGTSSATTSLTFTVTLSTASQRTATVTYATGGTATPGPDYSAQNGTLSFAPGETSKSVVVPVVADSASEPSETITLTLSTPAAATLGTATATTTLSDDDVVAGPGVGPGTYENNNVNVTYTGVWSLSNNAQDSGGNARATSAAGASATLSFNGQSITVLTRKHNRGGISTVYLDNVKITDVDTYNPTDQFKQVVFERTALPAGSHTIKIVNSGVKNPASTATVTTLDAVIVGNSTAPARPMGVTAANAGTRVDLTWTANTDLGLQGYDVYRSTSAAGPFTRLNGSPIPDLGYSDTTAAFTTAYFYTVRAVDGGGTSSGDSDVVTATLPAPVTAGTHENTSAALRYDAKWSTSNSAKDSGGSAGITSANGGRVELTFTGTSITWNARKAKTAGIVEVFIDEVSQGTIDLYSPTALFQQQIFQGTGLTAGTHTIRLERTGLKNAAATGTQLSIDSFIVG